MGYRPAAARDSLQDEENEMMIQRFVNSGEITAGDAAVLLELRHELARRRKSRGGRILHVLWMALWW